MQLYLWIMLGSALGGGARFFISGLVANRIGGTFPWGTFAVNVTGSFIIGFFATLTGPEGRIFVGGTGRQFFTTGICGGYTTFSSFSLQTLALANDDEWLHAGGNVAFSVICCLAAVWLGHVAVASINNLKGSGVQEAKRCPSISTWCCPHTRNSRRSSKKRSCSRCSASVAQWPRKSSAINSPRSRFTGKR